MAYIGRQLARGENKLFDDISSSFNGSTTTFTLAVSSVATATATPYQLFVSLGGVMQKPNTDFTTAGNQITFTTAPAAGLSCWIMMQGDTIDQAAIPDASVIPSKISGSNFAFSGDLRLKDADGSHYVGFASPTTVASNKVWTLPAADGSASTFLQTNGSGVLSWAAVTIGGSSGIDFNDNVKARFGTGNDLEIFHNASNSVINDAGTGDLLLQVGGTTQATISSTGVVIANNLTVSGTTTTINTQTLDVEDKNIVVGKVSTPSDTTADGGGITLKGASDKTFNWVNATDAWTSSEHIHLIDNKKLFVGGASGTTDGLEIVHNGSNSIINDSGTGTLLLQLGGSTKLEIQSGGINVTGAINVDGSALSTAPTITATANGALSAHDAVVVRTDGDVEKVAGNDNNINTASFETGHVMQKGMVKYDSARDKYVAFYRYGGDDKLYARIGTITGNGANTAGSITWTSRILVKDTTINNVDVAFSSYAGKFLLVYTTGSSGSGSLYCLPVKINTAADGFDIGDEGSVTSSTVYADEFRLSDTFDNNHAAIVTYRLSANMYGKAIRLEPNNTAPTLSTQSNVMPSDTFYPRAVVLEAHSQRFVAIQQGSSGSYQKGSCVSMSTSSSSPHNISVHSSATQFQSDHNLGACHAAYDSVSDKIFVAWQASTGAGGYAIILSTDGTSGFTLGTTTVWATGEDKPLGNTSGRRNIFCVFDPDDGRCHVIYTNNESKPAFAKFKIATDGSSYERVVAPTAFFTDATTAQGQNVVHDPDANRLIIIYSKVSNSSYGWYTMYQPQVTNLTAENFIGFSSAAYSNDATATINVNGNTTTKSSLTPGQKYYVTASGTLSLTAATPSVLAGVALSSTKLLVKSA